MGGREPQASSPSFDAPTDDESEPLSEPEGIIEGTVPDDHDLAPHLYSVQVGAFVSAFNTENLVLELQDRGYTPYIVTVDFDRQTLHTVRIGEFLTRDEAALAASEFFHREGMAAVVREVAPSSG